LLALLLVAGVSGGFAVSAPAGDKIEFSSLDSEDLARPAVERAESEPPDVLSLLSFDNGVPQDVDSYPMVSIAGDAATRRDDELSLNRRSGNDGLSVELDKFGQNGGLENSTWETPATNSSSNPASNYLGTMEAWGKSDNLNGPGPALDKLNPGYGQPGARLQSPASLEQRALQNGLGVGDDASRFWTSRKDDASGSSDRTSGADVLKAQNKSLSGANFGLFRPLSQFYGSKAASAWGSASMLPSDPSLRSPLDASEAGRSLYKSPIGLTPSSPSGNQDPGNSTGLPAMRGWGDDLGAGYQNANPAAARKPAFPPLEPGAQRQQGGATLPWPKMPGANY
jgi:hypothetical protein